MSDSEDSRNPGLECHGNENPEGVTLQPGDKAKNLD